MFDDIGGDAAPVASSGHDFMSSEEESEEESDEDGVGFYHAPPVATKSDKSKAKNEFVVDDVSLSFLLSILHVLVFLYSPYFV